MSRLALHAAQAKTQNRNRFTAPTPSSRRKPISPAKPQFPVAASRPLGLEHGNSCGGHGILGKRIGVACARGRPAKARERVLLAYRAEVAEGNLAPRLSRLARRAHIGDSRNVRRIMRDLRRLGEVTA